MSNATFQALLMISGAAVDPCGPRPVISGTLIWIDAKVTASLGLSGSNVITAADQSGNSNNMTALGGVNTPTYSASAINGRPALIFSTASANNSALQCALPLGTGNTLTFWAVANSTVNTDANGRLLSYTSGSQDWNNVGSWGASYGAVSTSLRIERNSQSTPASTPIVAGTPYVFIGTIDAAGAMRMYVNGTVYGPVTSAGNWVSNGSFVVGRQQNAIEGWDGAVGEFGVATSYSDSTTVLQLNTYLTCKWIT